jgi:all-trans-retinol dehydrogenase (NAD+)
MVAIAGTTVLITGAASGIGRRMAWRFAQAGATVVIWDLDEDGAGKVAGELTERSGRPHFAYRCDVGDAAAVAAAADVVRDEVGHVDILVNNAGVISGKTLPELTEAHILTTYRVNALALYWTTQAFLPEMIRRNHGHVVTIASAGGMIGVSHQTDYAATKHAAMGFDEALRTELRTSAAGVRTTVVCPFYVNTGMFEGVQTRFPWLLPILDEDEVARKVVRAVRDNRNRVFLPPVVRTLYAARVLPTRVFEALTDFLGVTTSMTEFQGRTTPEDVLDRTA